MAVALATTPWETAWTALRTALRTTRWASAPPPPIVLCLQRAPGPTPRRQLRRAEVAFYGAPRDAEGDRQLGDRRAEDVAVGDAGLPVVHPYGVQLGAAAPPVPLDLRVGVERRIAPVLLLPGGRCPRGVFLLA